MKFLSIFSLSPAYALTFGVFMITASVGAQDLAVLSAASYSDVVAPGSAATAFGSNLADESAVGVVNKAGELPRNLANLAVTVNGRSAQIAYVSGDQINFVTPHATDAGTAEVIVSQGGQPRAVGSVEVARLAPELFTLDGSGSGPGNAFNSATYGVAPFPVETLERPGCDKRTRLTVLASGIRYAGNPDRLPVMTAAATVTATLEGPAGAMVTAPVEFAGASEAYPGVDELRLVIPDEASAGGQWTLQVGVEGVASNSVSIDLEPTDLAVPDCSSFGAAFVYNTVADLLAGDLWDVTSPDAVFADLSSAPADWPVSGAGTTALEARNGEVIGTGSASAPELVWSDPQFPPTVRTLSDEPVAFVGVAAGNPVSAVVAQAELGVPIHQQILDLARENDIAFASIRVSGRFAPVSYSVAHNLLKQGTPLTDPTVDKAPFQLFFTADGSAEWQLSGFYAAAANIQEVASVRGAPVHLHGFQLDRDRAGHIGSAIVETAEIRLYPLDAPTVRDADLTLRNVSATDDGVSFEVLNIGNGTVSRTTVQGRAADSVVFQVELFDLHRDEPRAITTGIPPSLNLADLEIVVDPFNDVLEGDESNNRWFSVGEGGN